MKKKITAAILVLLMVTIVGLYVGDMILNGTEPTKNLFRTLVVFFVCAAGLLRIFKFSNKKRKSLAFYENQYTKNIGSAFADSSADRRKLLVALRFYNENKLVQAEKTLIKLIKKCKTKDDFLAVYTFLALCYTEMQAYSAAIEIYETLVRNNIATSTVYSNLGNLYSNTGDTENAKYYLQRAIQTDTRNPYPYNNIAQIYFRESDFENAIKNAKFALEINSKLTAASNLLAIIYALKDDVEESRRYALISASSGVSPDTLNKAIDHFKKIYVDGKIVDENENLEEFEEE